MFINFSHLIPFPIPDEQVNGSEIWGKALLFEKGEKILISGQSGTGKSTLVNAILGERSDYSGVLTINDEDIKQFSHKQKARLRQNSISVLPQGLMLFGHLSAWDNIMAKNRITSFMKDDEILDMMDSLNVLSLKDKKSATLSYGENQRVAIIRSLCQPFDFLLLDEPFSHLDKNNAGMAWEIINNHANKQHAGIVITSLRDNPKIEYTRKLYV